MIIQVEVYSKLSVKGYPTVIATPIISGISISQGQCPDIVTVTGDNFYAGSCTHYVDGVESIVADVKRKSFSFAVPYLKLDRTVKIELKAFNRVYPVTDSFHYL